MTPDLSGRIALVTGASRGIGRASAIALAKAGAHVILVARTVGGLEETDDEIQKLGGSATLVPLNLRDFDAIDRLGASIYERWGKLDAFLGNAGVLVADQCAGAALAAADGPLRLVVPGEKRGARSVRQLVRLIVETPPR